VHDHLCRRQPDACDTVAAALAGLPTRCRACGTKRPAAVGATADGRTESKVAVVNWIEAVGAIPQRPVGTHSARRFAVIHLLSFEGPDPYAQAGGIATRITGLAEGLAGYGNEVHLWFVGSPDLPGHESRGRLHLHRWCQWISRHHPIGVYDGEHGKQADYSASLPPVLLETLRGQLADGGTATVLAEEWQTVDAVLHLDWLLRLNGLRERVAVMWTANNVFGFERIDWGRLRQAAAVATISRYMRHRMLPLGVDPLVVPNGLSADAFVQPDPDAVTEMRRRLAPRTVLAKMARFDPDKNWLGAIDIVGELKRHGLRPLLLARGGKEAHGQEVLDRARDLGLSIGERVLPKPGARGLLDALDQPDDADVLFVQSHVDPDARRLLFRGAHAVLANSSHEPFGLVALETMAVEGLACTGNTGEDYCLPGHNALALQTDDPREFAALFRALQETPRRELAIRRVSSAGATSSSGFSCRG
jgi:hypothetical protein